MHWPLSRFAHARIGRERFAAAFALLALAPRVHAQQAARRALPPLELRADVIDPRSSKNGTLQVGLGVNLPLGSYVRLELDGAGGVTRRAAMDHHSGRGDALVRFLLDPFAESSWGLSIGGGMSALFAEGARTREYLVVVAGGGAARAGDGRVCGGAGDARRGGGMVPALGLARGGGGGVGLGPRASGRARR